MTTLYPSWIEIPVYDIERALAFYQAVFGLTDTSLYDDEPPARIAVLLPSEKSLRNPGVSLIQSPRHRPCRDGTQINFHVGDHAALAAALAAVSAYGGSIPEPVIDMRDGVKYVTLGDCEGNSIALSSYEPPNI